MNITSLQSALHTRNMRAFLRVIREGESSQGDDAYRTLFGGGLFGDLSKHPNRTITANGYTSTAAGAYQFLSKTWNECRDVLNLRGFTPAEQDLAAVFLIQRRGALDDVLDGRIEDAIGKCNKEWASLPGSPYGQPVMTLEKALRTYRAWRENDAEVPAATPVPSIPEKRQAAPMPAPPRPDAEPYAAPAPQPEKPKMAIPAIVAALLPTLIESIPKLGKLFGSGSAVAERNIAAATAAMKIAQEAVGAVNAQETVERIKTDPAAAAAATQAIESRWFELAEGGGGGIDGARKAALEYSQPDGPSFWFNPAFWISVVLLAMPLMLLVDVFYVNPSAYAGELRTQVVTGVLMVIGMVGGYWIGTSFSSAKKDERQQ